MSSVCRLFARRLSSVAPKTHLNEALANSFRDVVGGDNVSVNKEILAQHGKDESHFSPVPPELVVWPQNVQQVSAIAKICNDNKLPLIPFGTGTGLEGGVNALKGGVCVDVTKMNNVLSVNAEDFDCTVEAGVTWRDLNVHLRETGLWFPVDPGASASLGGMSATGASGTNAVKYGTMKQNVLNLEVVLADGKIIQTSGIGTRARKTSAGYNLTELFVGSEGTLGIITKVTLKLQAVPAVIASAVCYFPDVPLTINATIETLQSGIPTARIEFLDELSMKACSAYSKVDFPTKPGLFLEFHGSDEEEVQKQAERVREIISGHGGSDFECATEQETRNKLWKARHSLYYACRALEPGSSPTVADVCVPISSLTEMIVGVKTMAEENGLQAPVHGHVGDGNIHTLLFSTGTESDEARVALVKKSLEKLALSLGGTCTGEHGIGRGKMNILKTQFGEDGIDAMRMVKRSLDPNNILNPGKLF